MPTFFFYKKFISMTLYDYCAIKNPSGAANVVKSYGIKPSKRHPKELATQLAVCVKRYGDEALERISDVHPDLSLFQKKLDGYKEKYKKESMSNASGCGCSSNASGDVKDEKKDISPKNETLIMGGIILLGLALILRK
jgi:hypothetical protein